MLASVVSPGLWSSGLEIEVHRLSCPSACGILTGQATTCVSYIGQWTLPLIHQVCRHIIFKYRYFIQIGVKVFSVLFSACTTFYVFNSIR